MRAVKALDRLRARLDGLGFAAGVLRSTGLTRALHPTRWPKFARAVRGAKVGPHLATMFHAFNNPDKEALVEYETTLKTNPGRFDALYGAAQAAEQTGKHDKANDYLAKLVKNCDGATSERAELKHAREVLEARAAKN